MKLVLLNSYGREIKGGNLNKQFFKVKKAKPAYEPI